MRISVDGAALITIDNKTYPAKASVRMFYVSSDNKTEKITIGLLSGRDNDIEISDWKDISFSDPAISAGAPYTKNTFALAVQEVKNYLL